MVYPGNEAMSSKGEPVFLKFNPAVILSGLAFLGLLMCGSILSAQTTTIPSTGGTGQTTGGTGQTVTPQPAVPNNRASNLSGAGEGVGDLGQTVELDPFNDAPLENTRNQGFVGATGSRIQDQGFIGLPGQLLAPPLAEGAFAAGGVNDSSNAAVSVGGGGGGGGNAGRGGGAAGFGAAQSGVSIVRRSMRSRVQASFSAPRPAAQQVTSRFINRFQLQPGALETGGNYSIKIEDRTAFLTGSVNTKADSDRLERQLRLEPGVYKIVNQLSVSN